jgi:hypothetical protein
MIFGADHSGRGAAVTAQERREAPGRVKILIKIRRQLFPSEVIFLLSQRGLRLS